MSKRIYTDEHIDYLREISPGRYNKEITELFNAKFGFNLSVDRVRHIKSRYKIRSNVPTSKKGRIRLFTLEQQQFIRDNAEGLMNKELTELVNKEFGTEYTVNQITAFKNHRGIKSFVNTRFKKKQEPWNKGKKGWTAPGAERTWFKKGQAPINYRPIGSERTTVDGYVEVKIADPDVWKLKHRLVWEEYHKKEVPEGSIISFYDMDKTNFNIDNLFLLPREENIRMNQASLYSTNPEITKIGHTLIKLSEKIREKERGYTDEAIKEFSKQAVRNGISAPTFVARINRGWSLSDSINKPLNYRPGKKERGVSN